MLFFLVDEYRDAHFSVQTKATNLFSVTNVSLSLIPSSND